MGSEAPNLQQNLPILALVLALIAVGLIAWRGWWSLRAAPMRRRPFPPGAALTAAVLLFVAGQAGIQAAARIFALDGAGPNTSLADHARLMLGYNAAEILVVVVLAIAAARLTRGEPRWSFIRAAAMGIATLAVLWPILTLAGWGLAALEAQLTGTPPDPIAHETLRLLLESDQDGWFAVTVVLVVIVVPVTEEWLYRGLLQDGLREMGLGRWPAITATSVVFAAAHWGAVPPHAMVVLFLLSLGFGWTFERTGRLTAPIAMHAAFNALNLALAYSS